MLLLFYPFLASVAVLVSLSSSGFEDVVTVHLVLHGAREGEIEDPSRPLVDRHCGTV